MIYLYLFFKCHNFVIYLRKIKINKSMNRILKALRLLNPQLINGGNLDCNEESNDSLPLYEEVI